MSGLGHSAATVPHGPRPRQRYHGLVSQLVPIACAVVVAIGAAAPVASAPRRTERRPRAGKVVRVERNQPRVSSTSRICTLIDQDIGSCNHEVVPGAVGIVMDGEGTYGQATIVRVTESPEACGIVAWNIEIDVSRLTSRDYSYNAILLLDHPVSETAHTLQLPAQAPAGRHGERVLQVVDDDGDGHGDLLVSSYACDGPGQATPSTRPIYTCFDTWVELRDQWRYARTDLVPTCY
jgi:hypothetical protein